MLKRKDSVISFFPLVMGSDKEKFSGPIGVKKSIAKPIDDLILRSSLIPLL
jgi:hypothetical protein